MRHARRRLPRNNARRPRPEPCDCDRDFAVNRLVLTASLLERGALRYTPAGIPALDLNLKHESELTQEGSTRKVSVEVKARALGEITRRLAQLELGSEHGFAGFVGSQRNGRGVVFHVTELD